jgi:hypothetical protein
MVRLAAWHHQTDHRRSLKREKHYRWLSQYKQLTFPFTLNTMCVCVCVCVCILKAYNNFFKWAWPYKIVKMRWYCSYLNELVTLTTVSNMSCSVHFYYTEHLQNGCFWQCFSVM